MPRDYKLNLDFIKSVNSYLFDQIRLADTKAAWTFSVIGVSTAALVSRISKLDLVDWMIKSKVILMIIAFGLIVFSVKNVVHVIYPRVREGSKLGLFYFKDITSQKKEEYAEKISNLSEQRILKDLSLQAHALSGIVDEKFKTLRIAIVSTIITLLWVVIVLFFI
ncbi:hypothetical protein HY448_00455 [Candidatus Pacearchaeota archaeon]|nr:hypothetical protein [Candidatus Pacearchaeota archaeon]